MSRDTVQPWLGTELPSDEFDRWLDQLRQDLAVEEWREVGTSGNPAFENSWANIGGTTSVAAFYKDPFGVVHLKGGIDTGSTSTTAFTLPEGYRPSEDLYFPLTISGGYVEITIAGLVTPYFSTGTNVHLDGITFRV